MKNLLKVGLIATGVVTIGGLVYLGIKKAKEMKDELALLGPTSTGQCGSQCDCDTGCNCGCDDVIANYECEPGCVCEEGCADCCTNLSDEKDAE